MNTGKGPRTKNLYAKLEKIKNTLQTRIIYLGSLLKAVVRNTAQSFVLLTGVRVCIRIVSSGLCTTVLLRRTSQF
jgi:hypothetical protein